MMLSISNDDLDRVLLSDPGVAPSDDFLGRVMTDIRRECATQAGIGFPWARAAAGLAIILSVHVIVGLMAVAGDAEWVGVLTPAGGAALAWVVLVTSAMLAGARLSLSDTHEFREVQRLPGWGQPGSDVHRARL